MHIFKMWFLPLYLFWSLFCLIIDPFFCSGKKLKSEIREREREQERERTRERVHSNEEE